MKIKENEPLSKYTTFRMGGIAKKMYFPENREELAELVLEKPEVLGHIIGGGSNLLINDEKEFESILCLRDFDTEIKSLGNGRYYAGASVRLQKLIKTINEDGYGGIEYLYSVPGLVGGAIYMNAGRGKKHNKSISDYVESVDVLADGNVKTYSKEDCLFSYRTSAFQTKPNAVILGVTFCFPEMSLEESSQRIKERTDLCRNAQDMSAPNYGSVFCVSNKYIMATVRKLHPGYTDGCAFSSKTKNWMLNGKNGTFEQAISLLNRIIMIHKLFGQKCVPEVRIWY